MAPRKSSTWPIGKNRNREDRHEESKNRQRLRQAAAPAKKKEMQDKLKPVISTAFNKLKRPVVEATVLQSLLQSEDTYP